jgi:hypothetical protein
MTAHDCQFTLRLPGGFELGASGSREFVTEIYHEFGPSVISACSADGVSVSDIVARLLKSQIESRPAPAPDQGGDHPRVRPGAGAEESRGNSGVPPTPSLPFVPAPPERASKSRRREAKP